jgi:tetratricopeptide (TPR) repeat protein
MTEALLIGIGQYDDASFQPLAAPDRDVAALQELLRRPDIGASRTDDVTDLNNPTLQQLRDTIETFCTLRDSSETVVIYISGYAIVNDNQELFLPCRNTARSHLEQTAYSLSELKAELEACPSRQQVVILDCCFSGTFAKDMIAPQDFEAIAKNFVNGHRALLTSPTSIDYSAKHKSNRYSIYTQFIIDALETGMADGSANQPMSGDTNVTELHAYISTHLQDALPALSPTMHSQGQGYTMTLVNAPYLNFRQEAKSLASQGEISIVGHNILQELRIKEGIPENIANSIREDALLPYRQQVEKQRQYDSIREQAIQQESPNTQAELLQLRQILGLQDSPFATEPIPAPLDHETVPPAAITQVEAPVESETPVEAPTTGQRFTQFLRERRLLRSPDAEPATDPTSRFLQERNISPELLRLGLASLAVLALLSAVLWTLFQPLTRPQITTADGWFEEGIRKAQAGNSNAAIEAYTQALNLSPTPANRAANLYYNRGVEYARNNNFDQAFADYNEAIRLDPALADAYFNRANIAARRGDRSAAIKDYRTAARLYQQQNSLELQRTAQDAIRALEQSS